MDPKALHAAQILRANPDAISCTPEPTPYGERFQLAFPEGTNPQRIEKPAHLQQVAINTSTRSPFHILRMPTPEYPAQTAWDICQDEPIKLGCQVQPDEANWVGTAGCPIRWQARGAPQRWGLLSNWHVLADGNPRHGRPIFQPTAQHPAIGALAASHPPRPEGTNFLDAAIADTFVAGYHTTDFAILGIGRINPQPTQARRDLAVEKVGRTTGHTRGRCARTGVAVRVAYPDFTALFADQDEFEGNADPFSAPGDSGSLIFCAALKRPCSLLFAGNAETTIANPIAYVSHFFNAFFNP